MVKATGRRPSSALYMAFLEIQVSDLERAVGFYQAVFEWGASRPDSSYAVLDALPVAIGLSKRDSVVAGGAIVVIGVPDLEMILARVVEHGGALLEPVGPSWRGRERDGRVVSG